MKRFVQFILVGVVFFFIFLGVVWFGGPWLFSFSVAQYDGVATATDIAHPVAISFDARGVPQIWAKTNKDLLFSLGWIHASERLFQMELIRRMAAGELSELFGDFAYDMDLFQKKIGLHRMAERDLPSLDAETRVLLEQYCRGINAWIEQKKILPPELMLLRITPEPWTPLDCVTIMLYQTWFSTYEAGDDNETYRKLLEKFGDEFVPVLTEGVPWTIPTIRQYVVKSLFKHSPFPLRMTNASNSWVLSPGKSATNAALHAADPHLDVYQIPGFWYLAGMHSEEGLDVLGATIPGLPFVVMGHNGTIAYSFTIAGVDIIDSYRYQKHPDEPDRILTERGYQMLETREEAITVGGEKAPRKVMVQTSDRGVVVEEDSSSVTVLRWAGFDFNAAEMLQSAFKLMMNRNFSQFRQAVTSLGALNVNWLYSDVQGNIGYQLGTPVPRRRYDQTFEILDGADPETAWQGYYSLQETPYQYNSDEQWLASCNNPIVPKDWPYTLPGFYNEYRVVRVQEFLSQDKRFSADEMRLMQMDTVSMFAQKWKSLMADGAKQLGEAELERDIRNWDASMSSESHVAALFLVWSEFFPKVLFEDELGDEWSEGSYVWEHVLTQQLQDILDDHRTENQVETAVDLSAKTLQQALDFVKNKRLQDISLFEMEHPLAGVPLLDSWLNLNRGPYHVEGDWSSLHANTLWYDDESEFFYTTVAPNMRFVLDWSDIDALSLHTNLGQSGNPFSPHYDDFLDIGLEGKTWNVPFSREAVYAQKASLFTLLPLAH